MPKELLFEPWGLGDAIIAASVARLRPERFSICCAPRWAPFLEAGFDAAQAPLVIVRSLSYTSRGGRGLFHRGEELQAIGLAEKFARIHTVRGDMRDVIAARKLFPGVPVNASGWLSFLAIKIAPLDLLLRTARVPVEDRYRAWTRSCGLSRNELSADYARRIAQTPPGEKVLIHIGAQWRSKQYPHIAELTTLLRKGSDVLLVRGPRDPIPQGLTPEEVLDLDAPALIDAVRRSSLVITNDSGPMHLAAYLGRPTLAIARVTNIAQWLPPHAHAVISPRMPRGYRPDQAYASDQILSDWPSAEEAAEKVRSLIRDR